MVLWLALKTIVSVYIAFKIIWAILRWHVVRTTTVLGDLKDLNLPSLSQDQKVQGTAVIAGGSLSGLVTARILASYFTKVVIVEPETGVPLRGRVGQRAVTHKFHDLSIDIFRGMFPNFEKQARSYGINTHNGWYRFAYGKATFNPAIELFNQNVAASRVTLEKIIYDLTIAFAGSSLETVHGVVTAVDSSADGKRISSVTVRVPTTDANASGPGSFSKIDIPTVFFADCSGATTISAKLLSKSNTSWGPFPRNEYRPNFEYSSATVTISKPVQEKLSLLLPKGDPDYGRWDAVMIFDLLWPSFASSRDMYMISKVDNDKLILGLGAWGDHAQCKTFSQYVEIVQRAQDENHGVGTLTHKQHAWTFEFLKALGESIDNVEETVEFSHYKVGTCQWTNFEGAELPSNFVAIGDSRMRVNPVFAQGTTKLASDAVILNSTLRALVQNSDIPDDFSRRYFTRQLPSAKSMFDVTRMLDYGFPTTTPQSDEDLEFGRWFRYYWLGLVRVVSKGDGVTAGKVLKVMGGGLPGLDLFHPWNVTRVYAPEWLWSWAY